MNSFSNVTQNGYKKPKKATIEPTIANICTFIKKMNAQVITKDDSYYFELNGQTYHEKSPFFFQLISDQLVMEGFKKSGLKAALKIVIKCRAWRYDACHLTAIGEAK